MGGCVISCMSMKNSGSQVENKHVTAIRGLETQSYEVGEQPENESRVRRSLASKDLTSDEIKAKYYGGEHGNLVKRLEASVKEYGNKPAMAWREIEKMEKAETEIDGKKKMWEFIHLKNRESMSYTEMWKKMLAVGRGLASIGVTPGSLVGLYEDTRYEWLTTCYGAWSIGATGVTVYANLGEEALVYAIKESELPVMFCNGKAVKNLVRLSAECGFAMPKIIYTDTLAADTNTDGVEIYSFADIVKRGEEVAEEQEIPADPSALALIMYTSGTTGDPKGVMISHGNIYAAVAGADPRIREFLVEGENIYVAYLPLAHILEFTVENIMLMRGFQLGYGNARTLTNTSAKPHGDLQEFKPTLFAGVPRIYDTIKKAVEGKLPPPGDLKRRVFDRAFEERKAAIEQGLETPYWNEKVFKGPRDLLGGRCRMLVSGGAPLSAKTQEFLHIVFGCSVGQGWGLTETCAAGTIQRFYDCQTENIGSVLDVVEIKLRDVEDWKHTDPEPRGEVLLRGPTITQGYYKQPEKTAEAYKEDGWFHTGDVGTFKKDGTMKIIGRVKALAKNANGEYIAMEALESTYVLNDLVMPNGVCVLVHPHRNYIAALALTDEAKAMKFAKANGIEGTWPAILDDDKFQAKACESMGKTALEAGRKPFEKVKTVRILNEEWTPENGVLTAAQKLKRRVVDQKYADLIAKLFASE